MNTSGNNIVRTFLNRASVDADVQEKFEGIEIVKIKKILEAITRGCKAPKK